jgi:hypothetical protein
VPRRAAPTGASYQPINVSASTRSTSLEDEASAAVGGVLGAHGPVVRVGGGPDDRQPQSGAVLLRGVPLSEALRGVPVVDARAVVPDVEPVGQETDPHGRGRSRVFAGVAKQVLERGPQPLVVVLTVPGVTRWQTRVGADRHDDPVDGGPTCRPTCL